MEGWIWAASPRMPMLQNSSKNGQFTAISNNWDESHKHRIGQDRSDPRARSSWCQFYKVQAQAEIPWSVLKVGMVAVPLQAEPMEGGMRRLSGCFFPSGLWVRRVFRFSKFISVQSYAQCSCTFFIFGYAGEARGISVPQPGIKPGPWQWKCWIPTTRPSGNPFICVKFLLHDANIFEMVPFHDLSLWKGINTANK